MMSSLPDHLLRFIEINAAARVFIACRKLRVSRATELACYTRAVQQAVLYLVAGVRTPTVAAIDACLNQQIELLEIALRKPPPPRLPARVRVTNVAEAVQMSSRLVQIPSGEETFILPERSRERWKRKPVAEPVAVKSLEEKLEAARQPLRKLLQEDCVRLGLLDAHRAAELVLQLAGKALIEAEAEIVAEVRNNLHQQINYYTQQQGGPWDASKSIEDLHLDITHANSLSTVVLLTRQLLNECKDWEQRAEPGRISQFLGNRFINPS